jgi:Ser/Thr protein kinase RdoA (MazF antagonist)
VSVARAVPSQNGKLVEVIDDEQGGQFLVSAFTRAIGQKPWEAGWSTARYETYGELLGKMHALAVEYQPARPNWRRPEWDADSLNFIEQYLPASEVIAHHRRGPQPHLQPAQGCALYGLIHQMRTK